jgi:uncharacterized protein
MLKSSALRNRIAVVMLLASVGTAFAQAQSSDVKLPKQIAIMGFDTGAAAFNMMVAVGQAFKNAYDIDLRIIPASNDVARLAPLRAGRTPIAVPGTGVYYAQEGIDEFGAKTWGPQKFYRIMSSSVPSSQTMLVAKDTGVKTIADLRGKRVAWVVGAPSINRPMTAQLAFGGLTWDDVKKVEFSGYIATYNGMINGDVDAVFGNTALGKAREVDLSPRGAYFPPLPHSDEAGWTRMRKIAPFFYKMFATEGVGLSKSNPLEAGNYLQPNIIVSADQSDDFVYNFVKGMILQFDNYKNGAPGADGFALDRVVTEWVVPFHPGAIKALKEFGKWNEAAQKHNDGLIRRQDVLAKAWAKMESQKSLPDADFKVAWQKTRAETLRSAGLDPVWDTWD